MNVSRTSIGKYETQVAYPDVEKLVMLANIYECSSDYLLGLSDNERILTINEISILNIIFDIATKENIISNDQDLSDDEVKILSEEIETAYIAYSLFKKINKK